MHNVIESVVSTHILGELEGGRLQVQQFHGVAYYILYIIVYCAIPYDSIIHFFLLPSFTNILHSRPSNFSINHTHTHTHTRGCKVLIEFGPRKFSLQKRNTLLLRNNYIVIKYSLNNDYKQ